MYCRRCGNKIEGNHKYCKYCGIEIPSKMSYEYPGYPTNETINTTTKQKKNIGAVLLALIVPFIAIVIIITIIGMIFKFTIGTLDEKQTQEYVNFNDYQIPTVYKILGEKDICSYKTSSSDLTKELEFFYCKNESNEEDLTKYAEHLAKNEKFAIEKNFNRITLKKELKDKGNIKIEIDIINSAIKYYYTTYNTDNTTETSEEDNNI